MRNIIHMGKTALATFSMLITANCFASEISVNSNTILFKGDITYDSYLKLKDTVATNPDANEIVLTSTGGNMLAGLAMGTIIKSRNLNVRVLGVCASSCANYLFIAGNRKTLAQDALVIFHGGVQQDKLVEAVQAGNNQNTDYGGSFFDDGKGTAPDYILNAVGMKKTNTLAEALPQFIETERKYFSDMQVVNDLPTHGLKGMYATLWNSKKYQGFYYDLESLNRLGIKNLTVEGNQWQPNRNPLYPYLYSVRYP